MKRPGAADAQQPEAAALRPEVTYLPGALHPRVWRSNVAALLRSPGRYAQAFRDVVHEWRADRRRLTRDVGHEALTPRERFQGFYNTNALLYLVKSLVLAWKAVDLGRTLQRDDVTHVHAHWASYPATVAYVVHRVYGIDFSFTAHAYDSYMMQYLLREKLRAARFVLTCAETNAAYLAQAFGVDPAKVVVNYHGTDLHRFSPRARQPRAVPLVLTCGRLERYKGMHILLEACARLANEGLAFECRIVGEGPQRRDLEALAARLGLTTRVHFLGPVTQARLAEMMAETSVFVLASVVVQRYGKQDVIPNVLVEAMASGVPVVASDVGGVGELVRDGRTGRLVPPGRPVELAAAIADLLRDAGLCERLAAEGRRFVQSDFDREVNVEVVADFMRAAASGRPEALDALLAGSAAVESRQAMAG